MNYATLILPQYHFFRARRFAAGKRQRAARAFALARVFASSALVRALVCCRITGKNGDSREQRSRARPGFFVTVLHIATVRYLALERPACPLVVLSRARQKQLPPLAPLSLRGLRQDRGDPYALPLRGTDRTAAFAAPRIGRFAFASLQLADLIGGRASGFPQCRASHDQRSNVICD